MAPIRLVVTDLVNPENRKEYVFDQDRITIGRGGDNHLSLPDEKRIVSTEHAELRQEDGRCQLVDLESKNFTYLNGERLTPGKRYPLSVGDQFRIGDFEVGFELADRAAPEQGQTVFDPRSANPFEEQAEELASLLRRIRETYDREPVNRRMDALREAVVEVTVGEAPHEAEQLIGRVVGGSGESSSSGPGASSDDVEQGTSGPAEAETNPDGGDTGAAAAISGMSEIGSREQRLMHVLLRAAARLIPVPWRFRHEFIGQTIMQEEGAGFLYEDDEEVLGDHLLDASLSDEAYAHRLQLLEEALEDLLHHHLAMVEGYKASAQAGSRKLLDILDPRDVETELSADSTLYKWLPVFARLSAVGHLQQRCDELRSDDWSVAERRVFRPAFIKAYLARMTAPRRESSASDRSSITDHFS